MSAAAVVPKEKTKAKQRYLNAKKERRKRRKSTAAGPSVASANGVTVERDEQKSEDEGEDEDEQIKGLGAQVDVQMQEEQEQEDVDVAVSGGSPAKQLKKEQKERAEGKKQDKRDKKKEKERKKVEAAGEEEETRPRKRRRLKIVEDADEPPPDDQHAATPDPSSSSRAYSPVEPGHRTPTPPPTTLPSFPLPSRPNPPGKSELASQGLDRDLARAQLVDPTLSSPLSFEAEDDTGLSLKTRTRLKELGITELFAVQTTLLPLLLPVDRLHRALYLPYDPPNDICVSAPTGSGKTLAYVLPVVETLSTRIVTRLRALVVLPTRDLVAQVRETFEAVSKGRGLKIGTATGQHSFAHEQAQLVGDRASYLQGGSSKVDILICTPGRLMDHVNGTPNFSLQHLRFLIIDEADRLLAQSFQDWLSRVLAATRPPSVINPPSIEDLPDLPYPDALAPTFLHLLRDVPNISTDIDEKKESSCQKLLFSATLMSDPGKIAALDLRTPRYIVVQTPGAGKDAGVLDVVMEKFSMPMTLKEHMVVCESSVKPLVLFHLVLRQGVKNALVFTKSAESTLRLVRLFDFFEKARLGPPGDTATKPIVVRAYSSDLAPSERRSILEKFKNQEIDLLVASDLISRGIDISHVAHVVSYDVPVDMRKYVHRVGRTARAGRNGNAWTLVEEQEARYFKDMLRAADRSDAVARVRVTGKELEPFTAFYEAALKQLKEVYTRDRRPE